MPTIRRGGAADGRVSAHPSRPSNNPRTGQPPHLLYREQPDDRAGDVATVEAGKRNDRARPK